MAVINEMAVAKKNGARIPNSAKNPPIPGPIINPKLIAGWPYFTTLKSKNEIYLDLSRIL